MALQSISKGDEPVYLIDVNEIAVIIENHDRSGYCVWLKGNNEPFYINKEQWAVIMHTMK